MSFAHKTFSIFKMKLLSILLGSSVTHKIYDSTGTDVESEHGIYTEMEYNALQGLDLFEGDIEVNPNLSEKNIQMDLSYRWPSGKIVFEVGDDVTPNVVGVLHQAISKVKT